MRPQWIIEKKRDGAALDAEEIRAFVEGYTTGRIPDYQMSALAMAVFFQGMAFEEVTALTDAMMHSGRVIDASSIAAPKVDKHSTGGIGDKVSLVLAPLVACCGVAVPMISGRGLGITGGTLDKMESIPGYRTDLSVEDFLKVIDACGCSIIGQTADLAPADKKLYALRDVTGTVPSIPLISASIMSKKLAEGADALVLDVKWGSGAFMKTVDEARELGSTMVEIGRRMDRGMTALITDMNQPLGRCAGNAVEVREAVEALRGGGPEDLVSVTVALAAEMLKLANVETDRDRAQALLRDHLESGRALERFRDMVEHHGGDPAALDVPGGLPRATECEPFPAPGDGFVRRADAELIGRACAVLGAGRQRVEDPVDPAVGVTDIVKVGQPVSRGERLAVVHSNDEAAAAQAAILLAKAFEIGPEPPPEPVLIVETIGAPTG